MGPLLPLSYRHRGLDAHTPGQRHHLPDAFVRVVAFRLRVRFVLRRAGDSEVAEIWERPARLWSACLIAGGMSHLALLLWPPWFSMITLRPWVSPKTQSLCKPSSATSLVCSSGVPSL